MDEARPPVIRWTPGEAWLGTELVRRGLVVQIDDRPPRLVCAEPEARDDEAIHVEIVDVQTEPSLLLHLAGSRASIWLEPPPRAGALWRTDWVLELRRGAERWLLAPGEPAAVVERAGSEPLRGSLLTYRRFLVGAGEHEGDKVRLEDRSFHRYTRQSSADERPRDPLSWAAPTLPERRPYWEIDLGRSYYIHEARFDLVDLAPGATVHLTGYAFQTPADGPPSISPRRQLEVEPPQGAPGASRAGATLRWVARFLRVEIEAADGREVSLAVASCELRTADLLGDTLFDSWRRAFFLHRDRVMFVARQGDDGPFVPSLRYGEVGARAHALAGALHRRLAAAQPGPERVFFVLATRNRPEWVMADVAAIERGYVVVPVSPDEPDERLASIFARCPPSAMLVEAPDADRLAQLVGRASPSPCLLIVCDADRDAGAPGGVARVSFEALVCEGQGHQVAPSPRPESDLYTILFTSGSTGAPKGAMRSHATFHAMLASYGVVQPAFYLSFEPLSHLSGRMYLPVVFLHGGTVAFSRGGAHVPGELRAFEPTVLGSVPRLYDLLYASYRRRLREIEAGAPELPRASIEARALAEARGAFGGRLLSLAVGSAPVSPEVLAFLRRAFSDIWVSEGYGSTEVGTIATNGKIAPHVEVKLVPLPGDTGGEAQAERGEIWVRSPHTILGYLGDDEASASSLDSEGFFRTGDLGERSADGTVRVVGRLKNAVKLAQGEFVASERVEAALATAPVVDRIFVHVEAGAPGVSALVIPDRGALAAALSAGDEALDELVRRPQASSLVLSALRAHGRRAGLAPHELPRGVVLGPSLESGLLTASGKLARGAIAARHGAALRAAAASEGSPDPPGPLDQPVDPGPADDGSLASRLARAASRALGRVVSPSEPLVEALDSLGAADLMAVLGRDLGRPVPLGAWFASRSLGDLASRLDLFSQAAPGLALADQARRDLDLPPPFERLSGPPRLPPRTLLLTGATGFLGVHLLEELLTRTDLEVVCLARAPDDRAAGERLRQAAERYRIGPLPWDRVRPLAADLAAPRLGLDAGRFEALSARLDAVLHAAAMVSWLAPYGALRGASVDGTRALLGGAAAGAPKPFHFVSTISTAPADGDERSSLALDEICRGSPYALSKWIAEQHVRRAAERGLPAAVYRPAMIAPHSERGTGNPDDFIHRYLVGCAALGLYLDLPDQRLDMTPVDFVARAIVALFTDSPLGGETFHLVNIDQSMTYAELGRGMAEAGLRVEPAGYDRFRSALVSAGERGEGLRALASYFPEQGFSLAMGPWPSARTRERVGRLGVRCPPIDARLLRRYLGALRARGLVG